VKNLAPNSGSLRADIGQFNGVTEISIDWPLWPWSVILHRTMKLLYTVYGKRTGQTLCSTEH